MRRTLSSIEEDGLAQSFLFMTVEAAASWEWVRGDFSWDSHWAAFLK